ncbi:hypothetical protein Acr_17g0006970 [Actinidia rufa]|uniref:Uncharacterized protein n=1 Tax=Actinidia rufa TaxID=165716 RepID=A0A7J0G2V9_9ERIC|nr:hypothetical protein Acr_17g0006970 [Actinidia rufa]
MKVPSDHFSRSTASSSLPIVGWISHLRNGEMALLLWPKCRGLEGGLVELSICAFLSQALKSLLVANKRFVSSKRCYLYLVSTRLPRVVGIHLVAALPADRIHYLEATIHEDPLVLPGLPLYRAIARSSFRIDIVRNSLPSKNLAMCGKYAGHGSELSSSLANPAFFTIHDVILQLLERGNHPCDPAAFSTFFSADSSNFVGGHSKSISNHHVADLALIYRGTFELVLTVCLCFQNMALNRTQLLVHDNESLAQFRANHRIPDNVVIEQPGPNDDADWANEPDLYCVPRHRGYVPVGFNAHFWRRSYRCSAAINAAPRPRSLLLNEVSDLFEGTSAEFRRLVEEAEGEKSSSSESSSSSWDVDLGDEGGDDATEVEDDKEVNQVPVTALPVTTQPSRAWLASTMSPSSFGFSVPIPAAVPPVQPPDTEPILIPSSDFDVADDFGIVEAREGVKHSFGQNSSSFSSAGREEEVMAPKVRTLGSARASRDESVKRQDVQIQPCRTRLKIIRSPPSSLLGGKWKRKQPTEGTSHQKKVQLLAPLAGYSLIVLYGFNKEEYTTVAAAAEGVGVAAIKDRDPADVERTIAKGVEGARGA